MKRILGIAIVALAACSSSQKANAPAGANSAHVKIYYNNDNFGYLEPCGCRITPIGGMYRRWNAMRQIPEGDRLFVDAGNTFFKTRTAPEYLQAQWREQAQGVVEAYNLLGATALEPGVNDFALGLDGLKKLQSMAHFAFVSANLVEKKTGKLIFQPSVLVERNGLKVGIFGVFRPGLVLPEGIEATDPIAAAQREVAKLRAQGAELIVALSHQGYDDDLNFVRAVSGIDLLVGANSQSLLQKPEREGQTYIVQLSNEGQMLGTMDFQRSHSGPILTDSLVAELNSEYDHSPIANEPNPIKSLIEVTNIKIGDANRARDEQLWAAHQSSSIAGYQTFLNCRSCHTAQAEFQEKQPHAAAILTLAAVRKERQLDCVKCHSIGLGDEGGFTSIDHALVRKDGTAVPFQTALKTAGLDRLPGSNPDYRIHPERIRPDVAKWIAGLKKLHVDKAYVGVQCENCHGARPDHPFGTGEDGGGKVLTSRCLSCHTKDQMPAWYDEAGKVKQDQVQAALQRMSCPRNSK